ncbi:G/U mismatch-specific DNA glycosylase [Solwaraspora sp. WMMA2080]|uniref:G/U mismatch-specific DNA glycosylase n=1 Tax=unclassified Solwaraspora TaxID=2627926 RepID=UPI00248C47F0|nr:MULTISPECIES: G/U mismatch-specific DNA glycosylase [unclassified Solwaraspora]WBB94752.1 G/U mismatch-specific DNA glycosylase [Solwaraspora sp. WMMA2059]WBC23608.1 G/U mismatch-specific DNA glycosylase [Solwaraspora sp. WMMA2080]
MAQLLADAVGRTLPDVVGPDLDVLFCGINPSLYSAAVGHHFARPGNRFWPTLHRSGFTPRRLDPSEDHLLPGFGLGVTNLVARATARADELSPPELVAGGARLVRLAAAYRPRWIAVVGVTAYRLAFDQRRALVGPRPEDLGGARLWVLPNPSGLNAHYQLDRLVAEFDRLRQAVAAEPPR